MRNLRFRCVEAPGYANIRCVAAYAPIPLSSIFRLVRNSGYDYVHHRSNAQHESFDAEVVEDDRNHWLAHEPLMGIDTRMDVKDALENLQPDQREVWWLTEIGGYSLRDVAGFQGVPEGTIKSRRSRAKKALRSAIA
ncbi:RNA polymerase sigma factor [Corynebacterium sp. L4756]|uniref:RNA polymerase sigma factor n=1 Tax=unclassified Corynebacterium TaxID=2624378 RepID=UPI00374DE15E